MTILEAACAFLLGGGAYILIELFWRGRSHFSMMIAGGLSFSLLHGIFSGVGQTWPLVAKLFCGSLVITSVEFLTGAVVNIRLKWNVWDYAARPYSLYGQICLAYSLTWGLLTLPVLLASRLLSLIFS